MSASASASCCWNVFNMKSVAIFRVFSALEIPISWSKRVPPAVFPAALVTEKSTEFVGFMEDRVIRKARKIRLGQAMEFGL